MGSNAQVSHGGERRSRLPRKEELLGWLRSLPFRLSGSTSLPFPLPLRPSAAVDVTCYVSSGSGSAPPRGGGDDDDGARGSPAKSPPAVPAEVGPPSAREGVISEVPRPVQSSCPFPRRCSLPPPRSASHPTFGSSLPFRAPPPPII